MRSARNRSLSGDAMTGAPVIRARALRAFYGPAEILHGIDFDVYEGDMVVILGANGAGKTTLLRALSRTVRATGELELFGRNGLSMSADAVVRLGIAHVPQGRGTFGRLSVEENLLLGAHTRRGRSSIRRDIRRWFEFFPVLAERARTIASSLSGGEQQMLAIARALMCEPRLLLLDEPSLGLAPNTGQQVFDVIAAIRRERQLTAVLVEQNERLGLRLATRVYIAENGQLNSAGTPVDGESVVGLESAYLGA